MVKRQYLACPGCGRCGVYLNMAKPGGSDIWQCRYRTLGCTWTAYSDGHDAAEAKKLSLLKTANPNAMW